MTSEDTTTPALVSRRTILRTGANAAWMVPAISIATAVPASAACSTATAPHFKYALGAKSNPVRTNQGSFNTFTQKLKVTSTGKANEPAAIVVTVTKSPYVLLSGLENYAKFDVTIDSGWSGGLTSGQPGRVGSKYTFTRSFACAEESNPTITIKYNSAVVAVETIGQPVLAYAVTPS